LIRVPTAGQLHSSASLEFPKSPGEMIMSLPVWFRPISASSSYFAGGAGTLRPTLHSSTRSTFQTCSFNEASSAFYRLAGRLAQRLMHLWSPYTFLVPVILPK